MTTITLYLDTRYPKKGLLFAVKLTVYHNKRKKRYGLEIDLTEDDWNKINAPNLRNEDLKETRQIIEGNRTKAQSIVKKLGNSFSFNKFEKEFFGQYSSDINIDDVYAEFDKKISRLKKEGRIGSAVSYECALNSLRSYKSRLAFDEVTPELLRGYEKEMIKSGKSITTVGFYLRSLRHIVNLSLEKGIITSEEYAFRKGRYEIPGGRNQKLALSIEDLKKVLTYKTTLSGERKALDFWIFSYLCNGMNMADICRLKYSNIEGDYINFVRKKTALTRRSDIKSIRCFLTHETKAIIKTYGNQDRKPESYIFPILSAKMDPTRERDRIQFFTRSINKNMKNVAKKLGIAQGISTYSARHSFATLLKRKGISIDYIKDSLGHADLKTTENYLDSFLDETIRSNTKLLTEL